MPNATPIVAYYRVSTDKQGASGLGIEAQQEAVRRYAADRPILAEFTEVESGKRSDRPQLQDAIRLAKKRKATLVVAKLDRLARNAAFLLTLLESSLDFVACDNPQANRLTIGILAVVAEDEARRISERTKAALAAYKARGGVLGGQRPNHTTPTPEAALRGSQTASRARRETAREYDAEVLPSILECQSVGFSLRGIAEELNRQGFTTIQGKQFSMETVRRILNRQS